MKYRAKKSRNLVSFHTKFLKTQNSIAKLINSSFKIVKKEVDDQAQKQRFESNKKKNSQPRNLGSFNVIAR
jgi:hypothetical protein